MIRILNLVTFLFFSLVYLTTNTQIRKSEKYSRISKNNFQNFSDTCRYDSISKENELLNRTFELNLIHNKEPIEGVYVLNSCENGRFSIAITNIKKEYLFKIFDKKKIISSGKASLSIKEGKTSIGLKNIGGLIEDNVIMIQNYGNAMNEYNHFTQCGEKYLSFKKNRN